MIAHTLGTCNAKTHETMSCSAVLQLESSEYSTGGHNVWSYILQSEYLYFFPLTALHEHHLFDRRLTLAGGRALLLLD